MDDLQKELEDLRKRIERLEQKPIVIQFSPYQPVPLLMPDWTYRPNLPYGATFYW